MASQASTPAPSSKSSHIPSVPLRTTSHKYTSAQQQSADDKQPEIEPASVKIPDGRRTSKGEVLSSPVETWKPNLARRQSWNREDLKREHVVSQLEGRLDEVEIEKQGWGTGFSEEK